MQVLLVSVWACGFNLWSVFYVFIWWDLVPTSPYGKLHSVSPAMLMCLSGHIQYLRHRVSIGNRFPWHYIVFSLPDSSVSSYNLVFSRDGCQEEGRLHVSEERGISRRGNKKIKGGLIHFSALWLDDNWQEWNFCQLVDSFRRWTERNPKITVNPEKHFRGENLLQVRD